MTSAGHVSALSYTPKQVMAYLDLERKRQNRMMALLLSVVQVATSHNKRSHKAMMKALTKDSL